MKRSAAALAVCLFASFGLVSCKQVDQAVLMDYDQVNNFQDFKFGPNTPRIFWGQNSGETGISAGDRSAGLNGFWVTYVICNLRNEGPKAETFPYDASKFYVEYNDDKHYYKPLEAWTFSSYPGALPATPQVVPVVSSEFMKQTQLGPSTDTFSKGYQPALNYRISIYVKSKGVVDPKTVLPLRYEGYPNILNSRGHAPVFKSPATTAELASVCRPQAPR